MIQDELVELQQPKEKVNLLQLLVRPSLRLPLLISVVLHLSQQLTGIGGVSGYNKLSPLLLNFIYFLTPHAGTLL